jgi:hypothetical protein
MPCYLPPCQNQEEAQIKVVASTTAPGFSRAAADADLNQLFVDNLYPDLEPFQRPGGWSIGDFEDFVRVRVSV